MYHHFIIVAKIATHKIPSFFLNYDIVVVFKSMRVVIVWLLTKLDKREWWTFNYLICHPTNIGTFPFPYLFFFSSVWQVPVICLLCLGKCSSLFLSFFSFFYRKCSSFLSINKMVADKYAWSWHIVFEYLLLISSACLSLMTLHSFLPHTLLQIWRKIWNAF